MNDKILEELKEQTKYLKIIALPKIRETIEQNILTEDQKRIYELTDGINSSRDISKELAQSEIIVSHVTVANYWKKWASLGIVTPCEKQVGRFQKILS